jgi:hypothetical protein
MTCYNIAITVKSEISINAALTAEVECEGEIIINEEYIRIWKEHVIVYLNSDIDVDRLKVSVQNNDNYYNFA